MCYINKILYVSEMYQKSRINQILLLLLVFCFATPLSAYSLNKEQERKLIYLDYQASTPIDYRVIKAMKRYYNDIFGNPHSSHKYALDSMDAIEKAKGQIAALINAKSPNEIIFTSGATESDNLALLGVARKMKGKKNRIVTCITEHKAILEVALALETEGFEVIMVSVNEDGTIDMEELKKAITNDTALVSVMMVNNEIGVIQPINEIAEIAHANGALFHTDAAQAVGKIPVNVQASQIDLLSISGHKMYGPKGIGALYIKQGVELQPLFFGGGQQNGTRPGTLPTPLCVGLGEAAKIASKRLISDESRITTLRDKFLDILRENNIQFVVHGSMNKRIPGNLNISIKDIDATEILKLVPELAISTGSACSSSKSNTSYVVASLNPKPGFNNASLRIGFGRFTSMHEIEIAANDIVNAVKTISGGQKSDKKEFAQQESDKKDSDKKEQINKTENNALQHIASRYNLILIYNSKCPHCRTFAPIVKDFAEKYSFNVQAITLDRNKLDILPNSLVGREKLKSVIGDFQVKVLPTLLAINKSNSNILLVTEEYIDESGLKNKILTLE